MSETIEQRTITVEEYESEFWRMCSADLAADASLWRERLNKPEWTDDQVFEFLRRPEVVALFPPL